MPNHSPQHTCDSPDCGCRDVNIEAALRVAVITLSDTRSLAEDRSGDRVAELLQEGGHVVAQRLVMSDDAQPLREKIAALAADDSLDAIISTGGTGIAPRDMAVDVIESLLEVSLPGFGEHFRALSIAEIGPKGMLSRATAGRIGHLVVFALPGSTGAVTTAMNQCVLPIIRHASALVSG
ncbi:MogA/MoaB family molybdenum cofactor biosynthesis protein [Allorhodopirellula solitaria]|uniref:Molybdenum cofactor biosynthesis protein B n=1 Tax=Allorhodopirellula solitaria TaxID=2527987 RepID=A0A5C5YGQ4_9BACT|nr:MogA/MoaB family molybdenum cofactor biosynthesis protein [Allorhodopirellula solitaria]TWT74123.1 Molybdenum cofactor biosynthesis protein B [Allorhodopirellula solitaria]